MSDIPEERTYYLRIILMCMDLTKETTLKVFRYLIKSEDIATFLASADVISKLKELFKNKILNKTEYNLVCSYYPNPEKFDIALLIRLIFGLFKNAIATPHLGWTTKPHPKDESLGADLIRLRDVRNKLIAHRADAKLSKAEYRKIKDKVQAILVRVIENIDPNSKEEVERRIDEYTKLVVDTENTRVKLYLDQLLEYQNEVLKIQEEVEELIKRSQEFQEYFGQTPDLYVRYIKLLFDGGRLVLCGVLERELDKHHECLVTLLFNNREVLLANVDTQYESCIFPTEHSNVDHTSWDVGLLASVILLVFTDMNEGDISNIEVIKTARLYYADYALSSLDPSDFMSVWTDLISSLKHLSMNISEKRNLEVGNLINRYKKKSEGCDADEYLDQLRRSGVPVKTLKDKHKETVNRMRQLLTQQSDRGIKFKKEHVLELKILTTCQNDETKKNAEDFLERNLQASFHESDLPTNLIRAETDKLVASINTHPDVKPVGVKRSCILLSFKSFSPSGLIHILDYCGSHHFKARLHTISNELRYLYKDTFLLQGHVTLESLSRVTQNVDNTEDESYKGLSIPLKCSSVDGVRYVLDTLKNEKTTNRLNIIAEKISVELKETVSINMTPDLLEFRDVFDETDSEGSDSSGIDADKVEDIHSTEKEWRNQKLDANRKTLEHSLTICTDETEKGTCEQEEDAALLRDSEGSGSGGIDTHKADTAVDRCSSEKEWENQKLDAYRKAAEHQPAICTDETKESTCEQMEDSTLFSEVSGSDEYIADKAEDRYSDGKGLKNQKLDANRTATKHPWELRNISPILETINRKLYREPEIKTKINSLISEFQTVSLQFKSAVTNEGELVLRQKKYLEKSSPSEVVVAELEEKLKKFKDALQNAETNAEKMRKNMHRLIGIFWSKILSNLDEIKNKKIEVSQLSTEIDLLQLDIDSCENDAKKAAKRVESLADELKQRGQSARKKRLGVALLSYGVGLLFASATGGASLQAATAIVAFYILKTQLSEKECEDDAIVAKRMSRDKTSEANAKEREKENLRRKIFSNENDIRLCNIKMAELEDISDALEHVSTYLYRGIDVIRKVKIAVQEFEKAMHNASLEGNTFNIFQRVFLRKPEKLAGPAQKHLETLQDKWEKIEEVLQNIL